MSGRSRLAISMVPSVEVPSTRITSKRPAGRVGSRRSRLRASFRAGMTTLTRGPRTACRLALRRWAGRPARARVVPPASSVRISTAIS